MPDSNVRWLANQHSPLPEYLRTHVEPVDIWNRIMQLMCRLKCSC